MTYSVSLVTLRLALHDRGLYIQIIYDTYYDCFEKFVLGLLNGDDFPYFKLIKIISKPKPTKVQNNYGLNSFKQNSMAMLM